MIECKHGNLTPIASPMPDRPLLPARCSDCGIIIQPLPDTDDRWSARIGTILGTIPLLAILALLLGYIVKVLEDPR